MSSSIVGRLHVITDVSIQSRFTHADLARLAIEGGADCIQFQDKRLKGNALIAAARCVLEQTSGHVPLIINDDIDVAATISAAGVHVGQNDASIATAREAVGDAHLVGASTGTLEEAKEAEAGGADYIGFGHIFPTGSKHKTQPPVGLDTLTRVCQAVSIPVIAIGGINAANAPRVFAAGAWGIAVIGAVCAAQDPRGATAALAAIVAATRRAWESRRLA